MKKHFTCLFITIFFIGPIFCQQKIPVYALGLQKQSCNGTKAISKNTVLQFFYDSTFTITEYKTVSKFFSQVRKQEIKGSYLKKGDTLFLNDSSSRFFPFIKDSIIYSAFAKDEGLRLFPARIILGKNECVYISYLDRPRMISKLDYCEIIELENGYTKNQVFFKGSYKSLSPQLSNKTNSF